MVAAGNVARPRDGVVIRELGFGVVTFGVVDAGAIAEMGAPACVCTAGALANTGRHAVGGRGVGEIRGLGPAVGEGAGAGVCAGMTATELAGARVGEVTATGTYTVRAGAAGA